MSRIIPINDSRKKNHPNQKDMHLMHLYRNSQLNQTIS